LHLSRFDVDKTCGYWRLLLTDGAVYNDEEMISLARKHRNYARIFSFGIGHSPNENLVRGPARVTRGVAQFISPDESIEDKVIRQFCRLSTPVMSDVCRLTGRG
jgi:Ca-activated chloride channel family protein